MDRVDKESFEDESEMTLNIGGINQVHPFYFVKYFPSVEDASIRAQIQETGKLILKLRQAGSEIADKLKKTKLDRDNVHSTGWYSADWRCRSKIRERWGCRSKIDYKVQEIQRLKQELDELYISKKPKEDDQVNEHIMSLQNRMHHGGINLVKERQFLKRIKQAKAERGRIISEDAMKPPASSKYWGSPKVIGSKQALEDQIKLESAEETELRMKLVSYSSRARRVEAEKDALENDVRILERELENINRKKTKAYEYIWELKTQGDEVNACHYEYLSLLKTAQELAKKRDVAALQELSTSQVEQHMTEWNNGGRAFREDYHKRMLSSLKRRQSNKDTQALSIDEEVRLINSQRW